MATYKIHPGIGIARLGNSDTEFYLAPETPAGLPMGCDSNGNQGFGPDGTAPVLVTTFRDAQGRIKRQAARFQVFVHDEASPEGRPLKIGDKIEGGGNHGTLTDIRWRVYLANKKACWYQFDTTLGERGYPRRIIPAAMPTLPSAAGRSSIPAHASSTAASAALRSTALARAITRPPFRRRCHRIRSIRWAR
jgi:hypothetical protein